MYIVNSRPRCKTHWSAVENSDVQVQRCTSLIAALLAGYYQSRWLAGCVASATWQADRFEANPDRFREAH